MLSSFAIVTEKLTQIYRINQTPRHGVLTSQGFKIDSNETTGSKIRTIYSMNILRPILIFQIKTWLLAQRMNFRYMISTTSIT